MGKPVKPPTIAEVLADMRKHFGAKVEAVEPVTRVYNALVQLWKEQQTAPTLRAVFLRAKVNYGNVAHYMHALTIQGRVVKIRKGVWAPVMGEKK